MQTRYEMTYLCILCRWQEDMRLAVGEDPKKCPECGCSEPYGMGKRLLFPEAVTLSDVFSTFFPRDFPTHAEINAYIQREHGRPLEKREIWRGYVSNPSAYWEATFQPGKAEALVDSIVAGEGWGLEIVIRDDDTALILASASNIIASRYLALIPAGEVLELFKPA